MNKKTDSEICIKMEECDDYGQFCVLDEEQDAIAKPEKKKYDLVRKDHTYGYFEKTVYTLAIVAAFIMYVNFV
jgi:cell division protein FtsL